MQVRKLDPTDRKQVDRWIQFPFALYRDTPQWVPPLVHTMRKNLTGEHPFYQHSTAEFFTVESEGQILARVGAMHNVHHNAHKGLDAALFGFFEAVDDSQAVNTLFEHIFDWARQRGLNLMLGPRGLMGGEGSVLIEGFEYRPALAIAYNHPYYDALVKGVGFEKDADFLSGYLSGNHVIPERMHRIADKVKERRGFWVKTFHSRNELREWVPRILEVQQEAFSDALTFYPPTEDEVLDLVDTLLTIATPELIKLVMKDDDVAGFIFCYYDVSAAIQRIRGRLWPFGFLQVLWEQRTTKWANINGLGLLPRYQGMGANAVLYTELAKTVYGTRIETVDVVEINEENFASFSDMDTLGVNWAKRHRFYKRAL